jgi:hypothetical protein
MPCCAGRAAISRAKTERSIHTRSWCHGAERAFITGGACEHIHGGGAKRSLSALAAVVAAHFAWRTAYTARRLRAQSRSRARLACISSKAVSSRQPTSIVSALIGWAHLTLCAICIDCCGPSGTWGAVFSSHTDPIYITCCAIERTFDAASVGSVRTLRARLPCLVVECVLRAWETTANIIALSTAAACRTACATGR